MTQSLPNGLNFDTSTGEISGTPTIVSASAIYTVTASNSGGDDEVELTIEVIDIPPATVTYNPNAFVETRGTAMISVTPSTTGGTVVSGQLTRPCQTVFRLTHLLVKSVVHQQ